MFSKVILIFSALAAFCYAGLITEEGHGHAVSSQSIVRNDQPSHHVTTHFTPFVQHLEHGPALVQQTSYLEHGGQLVHAPVVHAAPVVHHLTPVVQHVAPVVQHVAPAVHAPLVQHVAPVAVGRSDHQIEDHAPVKYEFSYSVEDPVTGDHKSQHEARDGDVVKGEYSLLQPDGTIRRVEYTADQHSGFNAVVSNSPSGHVTAAPNAHTQPHASPYLTTHH